MLSKIKNAIYGLFGLMMLFGLGLNAYDFLGPKVKNVMEPTPVFAGLPSDLKVEDARKWPGVKCREGQQVFRGKAIQFEECWDSSYSSYIFGHTFRGRGAIFMEGELAALRVESRDGTATSSTFSDITKQLDAGFKRVTLKIPEEGLLFWDYGKGTLLVLPPPGKQINPTNWSQPSMTLSMVVWTPKLVALSTQ